MVVDAQRLTAFPYDAETFDNPEVFDTIGAFLSMSDGDKLFHAFHASCSVFGGALHVLLRRTPVLDSQ